MQTFVATIGYDSTRVTRPVLRHGLREGDEIRLVQPSGHDENSRAEEAISDVKQIVTELQPDVTITSVKIPHNDFYTALTRCSSLLREPSTEVIVVLGGGARDIYLPLSLATLFHIKDIDTVLQFSDINGSVNELEIPNLFLSLSDNEFWILHKLSEYDDGVSMSNLSIDTNFSKSTVSRCISCLEDEELVRTEFHGKNKIINITEQGDLFINLFNSNEENGQ